MIYLWVFTTQNETGVGETRSHEVPFTAPG